MRVAILHTTNIDDAGAIKKVTEEIQYTYHAATSVLPITLGGKGFIDAAAANVEGCRRVAAGIRDRYATAVTTDYLVSKDGKTAYIEAYKACGFDPCDGNCNPAMTFSTGVGDFMADALRNGCRNFIVGIDELATIDAGMGMLNAIGYKMLTPDGNELPLYRGSEMLRAASIADSETAALLKRCRFTVALNDDSAFYASTGPAMRHAALLGANEVTADILDNGLRSMASLYFKHNGRDVSYVKGGGAGGGMAGALASFFNAKLKPATAVIPGAARLNATIQQADAVIIIVNEISPATISGLAFRHLLNPIMRKSIPIHCLARHSGNEAIVKNSGICSITTCNDIAAGLENIFKALHKNSD